MPLPSAAAIAARNWREEQQKKDPAAWAAKYKAQKQKQQERRNARKGSGESAGSGGMPSGAADRLVEDDAEIDRMIAEYGMSGLLPDPDDDEFWYLEPIEDLGRQWRAMRRGRRRRARR